MMSPLSDKNLGSTFGYEGKATTDAEIMHKLELIETKIDRIKQEVFTIGVGLLFGLFILSYHWK